jgi:uncharacterized protein
VSGRTLAGMRRLTIDQARRLAVSATGLAGPPAPGRRVDVRHLRRAMTHVGALQIDSVNVLARAHLLTLHARLGAFDPALLEDAAYRRGELFEYWAHAAAYVPAALHPHLRWRMAERAAAARSRSHAALEREQGYLDAVRNEIADRGPLAASELRDPGERAGPWWGWSKGKHALERLFAVGEIAVADRRGFTRLYDLAERVLPPDVLGAPTPEPAEAQRELLATAARAQGVGTAADLADHFRIRLTQARPRLAELVRAGRLVEVAVDGWDEPAYLDPQPSVPRRTAARALLCPFDPLVWYRPRAERLFGFRYRIEIYTPASERVHGYYVLPFLLGDRLVARVDLKADRRHGVLLVRGAFAEPDIDPSGVAGPLRDALVELGSWLGLTDVSVAGPGDLVPALRTALRAGRC